MHYLTEEATKLEQTCMQRVPAKAECREELSKVCQEPLFQQIISNYCIKQRLDRTAAEEVAQEVSSRIAAMIAAGEVIRNAFALGKSVARFVIKEHFRQRERLAAVPLPDEYAAFDEGAMAVLEETETQASLRLAVACLDHEKRIVLNKDLYGVTQTEIAEKLGMSVATVSRWRREMLGQLEGLLRYPKLLPLRVQLWENRVQNLTGKDVGPQAAFNAVAHTIVPGQPFLSWPPIPLDAQSCLYVGVVNQWGRGVGNLVKSHKLSLVATCKLRPFDSEESAYTWAVTRGRSDQQLSEAESRLLFTYRYVQSRVERSPERIEILRDFVESVPELVALFRKFQGRNGPLQLF